MSQVCELTGTEPQYGHKVSHSNRKAKIRWMPNLRKKRYLIAELDKTVTLTLSTRAIRTIDKRGGLKSALLDARENRLSERLLRLKAELLKNLR